MSKTPGDLLRIPERDRLGTSGTSGPCLWRSGVCSFWHYRSVSKYWMGNVSPVGWVVLRLRLGCAGKEASGRSPLRGGGGFWKFFLFPRVRGRGWCLLPSVPGSSLFGVLGVASRLQEIGFFWWSACGTFLGITQKGEVCTVCPLGSVVCF